EPGQPYRRHSGRRTAFPSRASGNQPLLSDLAKLRHTAYFDPLHHKDITVVVEAGAMRRDELARLEVFPGEFASIPPHRSSGRSLGLGIVAQVRDHFVLGVEQSDARAQVRDHGVAGLVEAELAR